tara:strand:- start:806 stop:1096 length:291 start_codon:yes stop_codon:yes gene_type:complete
MKLIIDDNNNIICKSDRSNEFIASEIKKCIWNANIIKRSAERPKHWIRNNIILDKIEDIDINNAFSVDLEDNMITIWGDNGLIDLKIIDIDNIQKL